MKKFIIIVCVLSLLVLPALASAQGLKSASKVFEDVGSKAGADSYKDVETVIGKGIGAALTLVGLIFLILMVYAGYLWMTARGEEEMVKKSQKIITAAMIGLVLVLSAYAITVLVTKRFEASQGTTQDPKGCCQIFIGGVINSCQDDVANSECEKANVGGNINTQFDQTAKCAELKPCEGV